MTVEGHAKVSKIMVVLAWLGFLLMLVVGFDRYLEKQSRPNGRLDNVVNPSGLQTVSLLQNRQGHYFVEGKVNDQWVSFIVDTGATSLSVPASVADRLGLKKGFPERTRTANGVITVYRVILDSVRVGPIELSKVVAHINPHMPGDDVLLGMSFLKHLDMTQKNNELTLTLTR